LKILTAPQVKDADQFTIKNEPIKSIDLMERAASKCFDWIFENAPVIFTPLNVSESNWVFNIVCGVGNNGGDGLAIARQLLKNGYDVNVFIVPFTQNFSEDFKINEEKLKKIKPIYITNKKDIPDFKKNELIVDAIFGIGLSKPVEEIAMSVITAINNSGAPVVSIDIPSGLFSDDNSKNNRNYIVKADFTLTFQTPKIAFFLEENASYLGKITTLDIQLHKSYFESLNASWYLLDKELISYLIKIRNKFSHKGNYGHALIVGGSNTKTGAVVLAAKGCFKAGSGLVTVHVPKCARTIIQTTIPEAMCITDINENFISKSIDLATYESIAIGPGMGQNTETADALKVIIDNYHHAIIFDADAINILSNNKDWLNAIPSLSIFTPHIGEFKKLVGEFTNDFEKITMQLNFSSQYNCYVVLKGAHTTISTPHKKLYFNSTGNPGMAKAGAGDTLTGIITGLKTQGYSSLDSCLIGVYIHGLAGDLAAINDGEESIMATDIINFTGKAFLKTKEIDL
jgi:ADP-dependent NAD(P)H-hydrate dehydratase / NAD(P)H-hydrate epimerase